MVAEEKMGGGCHQIRSSGPAGVLVTLPRKVPLRTREGIEGDSSGRVEQSCSLGQSMSTAGLIRTDPLEYYSTSSPQKYLLKLWDGSVSKVIAEQV